MKKTHIDKEVQIKQDLMEQFGFLGKYNIDFEVNDLKYKFEYWLDHFKYQQDSNFDILIKIARANLNFTKKIEHFASASMSLKADQCFKLWLNETVELLKQSEECLKQNEEYLDSYFLMHTHIDLAKYLADIAGRIYEGHWAYGENPAVDDQFNDFTEFLRMLWEKESKAWTNLAKTWSKIDTSTIHNDRSVY